jgi:DNA primase
MERHQKWKVGDVLDWIGRGFNDPKGSDFPKVLRIAAEIAEVELAELTEKELEAAKERVEIHNLFSEAVDIYHKNLTKKPELYDYIMKKWSITPETVDLLKIGYSTKSRDLDDLDETTLQKSGLVYVNDGQIGGEVFNGRIIFPYWNNGKVVYLIGRETPETPASECGKGMKYKKLLVHKEEHEYVSPCVQNSYFYGEDSLRGADYCIITEGVADCIVMLQAGFPCISPVTVQFRDKDHQKLLSLTKGLKRVYICNDNELNGAGLKGALSTAEALENEQIEARLITLPKPEGIDKIDIADYMKDHSPEDFKWLMGSSLRLWQYKLDKQVVSQEATSLDRLRAFKSFISIDLDGMPFDEWEVFVSNEVAKKFQLKAKDIKTTVDEIAKEKHNENKNVVSNPTGEEQKEKTDAEKRLSNYPENI